MSLTLQSKASVSDTFWNKDIYSNQIFQICLYSSQMFTPDLYDQVLESYEIMQNEDKSFSFLKDSQFIAHCISQYFGICNTSLNSQDSLSYFKNCFLKRNQKRIKIHNTIPQTLQAKADYNIYSAYKGILLWSYKSSVQFKGFHNQKEVQYNSKVYFPNWSYYMHLEILYLQVVFVCIVQNNWH